MTNIIQRQVLDVHLESRDGAFGIQNELSSLCNLRVGDLLDEVCSDLAGPGKHVRIDRLEIDLGALSRAGLENEFLKRLRVNFKKELSEEINSLFFFSESRERQPGLSGDTENRSGPDSSSKRDRIISPNAFDMELMDFFLTTGRLPWWAEKESFEQMRDNLPQLIRENPENMRVFLAQKLVHQNARQRLVYQFGADVLAEVVRLFAPSLSDELTFIVRGLRRAISGIESLGRTEEELVVILREEALAILIQDSEARSDPERLLKCLIRSTADRINMVHQDLLFYISRGLHNTRPGGEYLESPLRDLIEKIPVRPFHDKEDEGLASLKNQCEITNRNEKEVTIPYIKKDNPPGKGIKMVRDGSRKERAGEKESPGVIVKGGAEIADDETIRSKDSIGTSGESETETAEKIYINNAGLVLLWPYLNRLFDNRGLLKDGRFADERAAMKSMHLLHYLVWEQERPYEFSLPLNKLLCGWPLAMPVEREIVLSDEDRAASDRLISAAVSHWKTLKNTSVEAFRTSFLQREGVLIKRDKDRLLKVERKSHDMLLESLPWSISIVKLSWMKELIYLEW